jgi:hypothetical protein
LNSGANCSFYDKEICKDKCLTVNSTVIGVNNETATDCIFTYSSIPTCYIWSRKQFIYKYDFMHLFILQFSIIFSPISSIFIYLILSMTTLFLIIIPHYFAIILGWSRAKTCWGNTKQFLNLKMQSLLSMFSSQIALFIGSLIDPIIESAFAFPPIITIFFGIAYVLLFISFCSIITLWRHIVHQSKTGDYRNENLSISNWFH